MSSKKNCKLSSLAFEPQYFNSIYPNISYSFIVNTPELYSQLQHGQIDSNNFNSIVIEADAHPLLITQPQYYENAPYLSMRFTDYKNAENEKKKPWSNCENYKK